MKGHIRKRGDAWSIVVDLGRDEQGKRRQKWYTARGTKREAERELTRILEQLRTGAYLEPSRMTVGEYLDFWLDSCAASNRSKTTLDGYGVYIRAHLGPTLGNVKLEQLQPAHIQRFYTELLQRGRRDGRGGLSARTVLHIHRVLRQALAQAVKWQMLARNPADAVVPPRPEEREQAVLNAEQIQRLLQGAQGTRLFMPILLAVSTGMRRGEILGLRWSDIDIEHGTLRVQQTLVSTMKDTFFKAPKTKKGRRPIALPTILVEALKAHREAQREERSLFGASYQDHDLVVCEPDGRPRSPHALTNAFTDLMTKLGMPKVPFHGLRHSHATLLLSQNVHPKVVRERLGHSTVNLTLNTYSHILPNMQREAAERIDTALGGLPRQEKD